MLARPRLLWWALPLLLLLLLAFGGGSGVGGAWSVTAAGARLLHDIVAVVTVGVVVVGGVLSEPPDARLLRRGRDLAVVWWALLPLVGLVTLADIAGGGPVSLSEVLFQTLLGRVWLAEWLTVLVLIVILTLGRSRTSARLAFGVALVAVVVPALVGHGGLSADHVAATVSLAGHLGGVAVWVGGLAVLCAVLLSAPERATRLVPRFSALALGCALVVGETGLLNASLRLPTPALLLTTSYGSLVLVKAALFAVLVIMGWRQRRRAIPALGTGVAMVIRLASVELAVMLLALVVSVVLVNLGPPVVPSPEGVLAPVATVVLLAVPAGLAILRRPHGAVARWVREHPESAVVGALVVLAEALIVGLPQRVLGPELGALVCAGILLLAGWFTGLALSARRRAPMILLAIGVWVILAAGWLGGVQAGGPSLVAGMIVASTLVWWSRRPSSDVRVPNATREVISA
ncbi:MAG: CopD family protein [Candidatus Nanopelagicales bacterium]